MQPITFKVEGAEAGRIELAARAAGKSRSEWLRAVVLRALDGDKAPAAPVVEDRPQEPPAAPPAALRAPPRVVEPAAATSNDPYEIRAGESTFLCHGCGREVPLRMRGAHYKGSVLDSCPRCRQIIPSRERQQHYEREHGSESRIEVQ